MRLVSVGVVLSQRRTQLTGIEPAMGCDSGPPLNRNRVGRPIVCIVGLVIVRPDYCTGNRTSEVQ